MKTEFEQLRDELNKRIDDAIEKYNKPKLNVWYKNKLDCLGLSIFYANEYNSEYKIFKGYGFENENWLNKDYFYWSSQNIVEATESEVLEALIKESVKRGLIKGVKIKRMPGGSCEIDIFKKDFKYYSENDDLQLNGTRIYQKGQWAEVIKEKSSEEWVRDYQNSPNINLIDFLNINNLKIVKA